MAQRFCHACGKPLGDHDKFCMSGGAPVRLVAPAAPPAPPAPSPPPQETGTGHARPRRWYEFWKSDPAPEPPAAPPTPAPIPPPSYGEEMTTVLDEEDPFPQDLDDATTVLGAQLVVSLTRERTGERLPLTLPSVVGKGSAADCRIAGNSAVSRRHLRVSEDDSSSGGPRVLVEDLGSLNGTRLNGDALDKGQPRAVLDGDRITLADEAFVIHVSEG